MGASVFIAKALGILYVIFGLAIFSGGVDLKKLFDDIMKSTGLRVLYAIFTLFVGFLIVNTHNLWEDVWTVLITLIGWGALLKGVVYLVCPNAMKKFKGMLENKNLMASIVLLFGLIFAYIGFM